MTEVRIASLMRPEFPALFPTMPIRRAVALLSVRGIGGPFLTAFLRHFVGLLSPIMARHVTIGARKALIFMGFPHAMSRNARVGWSG